MAAVVLASTVIVNNLKWAKDLQGYTLWQTLHVTSPRLRFHDNTLNKKVGFARHAIAIDEHRGAFDRVPRANSTDEWRKTELNEPPWLRQYWFAGNHSDIGGSYEENESRLSDIALKWMIEQAQEIPDGLKVDERVLHLHPDATAIQHDECRSFLFRRGNIVRPIHSDAILHGSVYKRLKHTGVLHFDQVKTYRPDALKTHTKARKEVGDAW